MSIHKQFSEIELVQVRANNGSFLHDVCRQAFDLERLTGLPVEVLFNDRVYGFHLEITEKPTVETSEPVQAAHPGEADK